MKKALFTSNDQNWKTPKETFKSLNNEFNFDFDPCPSDPKFDGLKCEWGNVNFCNPPYKYIKEWIKKGFIESLKGKIVVFLIPSRTDTIWWHDYCLKANEIRFIKGRLYFNDGYGRAPFPSCIVIFRGLK